MTGGQIPPHRLPPSPRPTPTPLPLPAELPRDEREPLAWVLLLVLVWGLSAAIVAFGMGWLWLRHGDSIAPAFDAVMRLLGG